MHKIVFELCAETMEACLAAREGGADRIELCSGLSEGGITPSHGLVRAAVSRSGLPVHVLVRPRGGSYVYSADEVAVMAEDVLHAKALGAAGVVVGLLLPSGRVDSDAVRRLVELARPMEVTFHRAFDSTPSLREALEDVIATGCKRVLTSGGHLDVVLGADTLAALVAQAGDRIDVAVGGGLRLRNAAMLARRTGASHFHGSLQSKAPQEKLAVTPGTDEGHVFERETVDPEAVRRMVKCLRET
jgi:copper homeostasis protein